MLEKEQILLLVYFTAIILFFVIFGIIFFVAFQRRKNKLLLEKFKAEQRFEEELQNSKLEIQEQTLKNVSWELHDNIGQLLSTAVMQINILSSNLEPKIKESVQDIRGLVGDSLQEIRNLSKTLNHEVIQNIGLEKSIQVELDRFKKLNFLTPELIVDGEEVLINPKDEIIIYRIVQEFFSNTIKHAEASHLLVKLNYTPQDLTIVIKDDGVGYNMESVQANSGLLNMKSRASLVNASLDCFSEPGKGVLLTLRYPFKEEDKV
ncbi:histidine kinase [Aquimarina sp. AD1]|uniref:sensor histidine kinase n=1 Tax=Aquimarina sp. (strain AD1) TaxID=1714848 RepID=UPI000E4D62DA|nr:ATP-binding protein [Aquimarina sp. AD1]AXT55851.1 histidine kinase [Aquimarina sp. AD1]RKN15149.1 histidine kinase [Aquimarina sp. AD1]